MKPIAKLVCSRTATTHSVTNGTQPASAVVTDGAAVYSHGLGLAGEFRGGQSKWYMADRLGTVQGLTDANAAITNPVTYTAFGERRSGTPVSPFGFIGGLNALTDGDSGLTLMGHRYYQADIGRFLSPDPARSGDNGYDYCENDPVNSIDPLGLEVRHLRGDEKPFIQRAIDDLRKQGHQKAADELQKLLDDGKIKVDTNLPFATRAETKAGKFGGYEIRVNPDRFFPRNRRGRILPLTTAEDWLIRSSTLFHEWVHTHQGAWWQMFHPYVKEEEAYGWMLAYLKGLLLRGNISDQEREAIENEIERVRGELGETYGQRPAANAPIANPRGSAPIKGSPYTPGRPMLNP